MVKSIGSGGFASDGLYHILQDSNDEAKFSADMTRLKLGVSLDKPFFFTGTNPDNHLIGWWKCDDNEASTTILDSSGNAYHGTLSGGDNTEDISQVEGQGRALLLDGTADYLNLSSAIAGLSSTNVFTIIIISKPNVSYTGGAQSLFYIGSSVTDRFGFYYKSASDLYAVYNNIAGAGTDIITGSAFTSDFNFQVWNVDVVSLDLNNNLCHWSHNGQIMGTVEITSSWSLTPDEFYVGYNFSSIYCKYYIDSVLLLDGYVIPHGSPITLSDQVGDYSKAHDKLTVFWNCETTSEQIAGLTATLNNGATLDASAKLIGTNGLLINDDQECATLTLTEGTHFDPDKGAYGFWVKPDGNHTTSESFSSLRYDANNRFQIAVGDSDATQHRVWVYLGGTANSAYSSSGDIVNSVWQFLVLAWDIDADYVRLFCNGVMIAEITSLSGTWAGSGTSTLHIGQSLVGSYNTVEGYYDQAFVSLDPNMPMNWTANFAELALPLMRKDDTILQPGADCEISRKPDGSIYYVDFGRVVGA